MLGQVNRVMSSKSGKFLSGQVISG